MEVILKSAMRLSQLIHTASEVILTGIMLLTVTDVVLRYFGKPILGTYELIGFSGALVIAFSLPLTAGVRGHINVDILISIFPQKARNIVNILTRLFGIGIFFLLGWNLIKYGMDLHKAKEVSMTLQLPFYPVVYVVGICCLVQCLVLFCDILKIFGGKYE